MPRQAAGPAQPSPAPIEAQPHSTCLHGCRCSPGSGIHHPPAPNRTTGPCCWRARPRASPGAGSWRPGPRRWRPGRRACSAQSQGHSPAAAGPGRRSGRAQAGWTALAPTRRLVVEGQADKHSKRREGGVQSQRCHRSWRPRHTAQTGPGHPGVVWRMQGSGSPRVLQGRDEVLVGAGAKEAMAGGAMAGR